MHKYKKGDWITIAQVANTISNFNGDVGRAEELIGNKYQIRDIVEYMNHGARLKDDPIRYTWHTDDFVPPGGSYKPPIKPLLPKWVSDLKRGVKQPHGPGSTYINYILYRPKYGEIGNPVSWPKLRDRCSSEYAVGWFKTACYADLRRWDMDDYKVSPSWIISRYPLVSSTYQLTKDEIKEWASLLKKHHCIGKEAISDESNKASWTIRMKLQHYNTTRLYLALVMCRNVYEQPWVVRRTMSLMKDQGIDFFVAYALTHYYTHLSTGAHGVFDCGCFGYGNKLITAKEILLKGLQLGKYIHKKSLKEKSFAEIGGAADFRLHKTLDHMVGVKDVPDVDFSDLMGMSPKYT